MLKSNIFCINFFQNVSLDFFGQIKFKNLFLFVVPGWVQIVNKLFWLVERLSFASARPKAEAKAV